MHLFLNLQTPPRENWFQYVRREYATAINFPCLITLCIYRYILKLFCIKIFSAKKYSQKMPYIYSQIKYTGRYANMHCTAQAQGIGIKGKEMALVWHEKANRTALQTSSVNLTHTVLVQTHNMTTFIIAEQCCQS